jgi:tetratricopeptide (TPR) repeat protein
MSAKVVALLCGVLTLVLFFVTGDYDQADASLQSFYSQILSANFSVARWNIERAIGLWPTNARYLTWQGYLASQKLPPHCYYGHDSILDAEEKAAALAAITDYRLAIELNSRDAVAHHNLAWLLHLSRNDSDAAKEWHEATLIDPGNAVFHLSYGMFLAEIRDVQTGTKEIEEAVQLSPSILDSPFFAQYRLRNRVAADTIVDQCVARLRNRLTQVSDPILEARLGKLYQYLGQWPRSIQLLEDAAIRLPNLALVWFNLGEAYTVRGDTQKAMECYKKAKLINDSLAGPYLRIGQTYMKGGQKALAAQNLNQAIERWERVSPITASHNNRLYNGPKQRIDDLLPTTLLWYVSSCESSEAYRALTEIASQNQRSLYGNRVSTCEQIPAPHSWPFRN